MTSKIVETRIKGTSALLMNRFPLVPVDGFDKLRPDEQVKHSAYLDDEGYLYIPGINIQRCLIAAAVYSKGKGRSSLQKPVAACVLVEPEYCHLQSNGNKVSSYSIDSRAVVNPFTKGRIVRHRPRIDEWEVAFSIEYDPLLLKEEELRHVLDDAGLRVGLLDFRPEKKGPFGRFMVTEWRTK